MKTVALLALFTASCAYPLAGSVDAGYALSATAMTTPGGTVFDGPASAADTIDRLVREAEVCAGPITGLRVKVAADWTLNCDGTQQVLPIDANGYDPNKHFDAPSCVNAPWRWRALYQPDRLVVTTPSLYNVKDPIIRLVTGRQNVWTDPALAACAHPTTGPLDLFP